MDPFSRLRTWWQSQTGEDETPFDGDAPVWVVSMLFHLALMFALAFVFVDFGSDPAAINLLTPLAEEEEEIEIPDEFHFDEFRIN